jgi:hypothetical protein
MYSKQNVFETDITLPGRSEVSLAAATPCRLQLHAMLRSSAGKLSLPRPACIKDIALFTALRINFLRVIATAGCSVASVTERLVK